MADEIYLLIDQNRGEAVTASMETLAVGQSLAEDLGRPLRLLVLGLPDQPVDAQLPGCRVDSILSAEHERLDSYDPDLYCAALKQVLEQDQPFLLLAAHTYQSIDLMPKLAAGLGRGLVTSCVGFRPAGGELLFVRQMFRNKLNADVRLRSPHPWLATVQPGTGSAGDVQPGQAEIVRRRVNLEGVESRRRSLEIVEFAKGKVDLSKAEIVVGVGRGIKKEENLQIIRELAEILGAEIGASRPVVDNEWMARERQIGSSGQTVAPRLYVACGISGAIQHVVGMKNASCIVAINTDPNAPIFNVATYGIVGDLFEIVPALTRKLRESK